MNNTVILSTNCDSGPRELLKNKENSFVFNNNNKESFVRSFENLVNSDEDFKHKYKS